MAGYYAATGRDKVEDVGTLGERGRHCEPKSAHDLKRVSYSPVRPFRFRQFATKVRSRCFYLDFVQKIRRRKREEVGLIIETGSECRITDHEISSHREKGLDHARRDLFFGSRHDLDHFFATVHRVD